MSNIEKFDGLVAQVFESLYSEFPVRTKLNAYKIFDLSDEGQYVDGEWKETLSNTDVDFLYETLHWLQNTGYIIGTINNIHDTKITLSHKGLELMKSMPSSLDASESLGDQLKLAIKSGTKDAASSLVSKALSSNNIMNIMSNFIQ